MSEGLSISWSEPPKATQENGGRRFKVTMRLWPCRFYIAGPVSGCHRCGKCWGSLDAAPPPCPREDEVEVFASER